MRRGTPSRRLDMSGPTSSPMTASKVRSFGFAACDDILWSPLVGLVGLCSQCKLSKSTLCRVLMVQQQLRMTRRHSPPVRLPTELTRYHRDGLGFLTAASTPCPQSDRTSIMAVEGMTLEEVIQRAYHRAIPPAKVGPSASAASEKLIITGYPVAAIASPARSFHD